MNDVEGLYANAIAYDGLKGFNTMQKHYPEKKQKLMNLKAEALKDKIDVLEIEKMQLKEKLEQKQLKNKRPEKSSNKENVVSLSKRKSKNPKFQKKLDEIHAQIKKLEKKKEDLTEGNVTANKRSIKDILKERDKEIENTNKRIQVLEKEKRRIER